METLGTQTRTSNPAFAWLPLLCVAAARFALPAASALFAPIGYTPDEYYYLACADNLAWGYVDHPPFSIAVLSVVRSVFGDSIFALRLLPAVCEALAVLLTALLARELGGSRRAQVISALAMAAAPMALLMGLPYSMNPIEHLLWPLVALLIARLQNGVDARWWIVLGVVFGVALENKLSTAWFGAGLGVGLTLSSARSWLSTRWPWIAAAIALVMLAPHLVWQAANDWPTLEFIRNNATGREGIDAAVVIDSPVLFAVAQLVVMGFFAAPIWLFGLGFLLRSQSMERYRVLGWTFAATFAIVAMSGRASIYYLVGAFPIVFAAGGVAIGQLAQGWPGRIMRGVVVVMTIVGVVSIPLVIPVVDVERYLAFARDVRLRSGANPDEASLPPTYLWMVGAPELIRSVSEVVVTLTDKERKRAGILTTTFGDAGALKHFRSSENFPPVIGTHNNFWLWGTRGLDGSVMIVIAEEDSPVLSLFARCEVEATVSCPHCEPHLQERPVYLCRDPEQPLPNVWQELKNFI